MLPPAALASLHLYVADQKPLKTEFLTMRLIYHWILAHCILTAVLVTVIARTKKKLIMNVASEKFVISPAPIDDTTM